MDNAYYIEPTFRWWVNKVLKKRDRLVNKVKSRFWKNIFKFGVKSPQTVEDDLSIDWEKGNTIWHDAIGKDMKNSMFALIFLDMDSHAPVYYGDITSQVIFDVKIELTRKDRYVDG